MCGEETETDWVWSKPILAMSSMPLPSTLALESFYSPPREVPGAIKPQYFVLKCNGKDAVLFALEAVSKRLASLSSSRPMSNNMGLGCILLRAQKNGIPGISLHTSDKK